MRERENTFFQRKMTFFYVTHCDVDGSNKIPICRFFKGLNLEYIFDIDSCLILKIKQYSDWPLKNG